MPSANKFFDGDSSQIHSQKTVDLGANAGARGAYRGQGGGVHAAVHQQSRKCVILPG